MTLQLDFTNKVIMVVESGSVEEFNATIKKLKLQDWTIGINPVPYYYYPIHPNYPAYSIYPTYETTVASTKTGWGCSDKCNAE